MKDLIKVADQLRRDLESVSSATRTLSEMVAGADDLHFLEAMAATSTNDLHTEVLVATYRRLADAAVYAAAMYATAADILEKRTRDMRHLKG